MFLTHSVLPCPSGVQKKTSQEGLHNAFDGTFEEEKF
jgi:hypothetical protein